MRPLRAAALLSATILLARIIGLVQSSLISSIMVKQQTDAYTAAFRVNDFVNYLVAGGALSVTFIPIFIEMKDNARRDEAWRFFSSIASIMSVALLGVLALTYILVEPVLYRIGWRGEDLNLVVQMTHIMLPAQAFFYLGGMLVGVLNAHKRFGASSFTGAVYNVVAVVVGLMIWSLSRDVLGFAWGILIGAFCGNFLLPLVASLRGTREERLQFRFSLDFQAPGVRKFFRNALPIMIGVSFPVVDQIIMIFFKNHLGEGALTQLDRGNRVMVAPLAMLAQAASVAAFPYLAGDNALQKWDTFAEFLRNGLRRLLFIALPASTLLILLAQPIVVIIYRHGNYTSADAQSSAIAFAFYCIGMFAWAGQQFVARGLYALQDTITPTIIGTIITFGFFVPLCFFTVYYTPFPILGLALATSLGACAHFCGVLIALEKKLARPPYNMPIGSERVLGTILRTFAACLVMGIVGIVVKNLSDNLLPQSVLESFTGQLVRIGIIAPPTLAAFAWAAKRFQIPEWEWLLSKFQRRRKRVKSEE